MQEPVTLSSVPLDDVVVRTICAYLSYPTIKTHPVSFYTMAYQLIGWPEAIARDRTLISRNKR